MRLFFKFKNLCAPTVVLCGHHAAWSWLGLTDPVQSVDGDRLEGPPHHRVLLQHLVEVVHGERVQAAVRVGPHAGRPPAAGQQTDLWWGGERDGQITDRQTPGHTPTPTHTHTHTHTSPRQESFLPAVWRKPALRSIFRHVQPWAPPPPLPLRAGGPDRCLDNRMPSFFLFSSSPATSPARGGRTK